MKTKNRYFILVSGMIMQFCAGIIYMWSVFKGPVAVHLNWDAGSASLTSSIMLAMFVLGIILGGYAQDKLGPGKVTFGGSMLIGAGMACTALVTMNMPWLVYLTYGVISGLGVGTIYISVIAAIQKWFPDKRGFASGMIVCAFGLSLAAFVPLAEAMLNGLGVPKTFLIFGISFLVICVLCSLLMNNPPAGYLPKGYTPAQAAMTKRQYAPKEILKTRQFYLLAGGLLFTLPAYFILNPVFKELGEARGLMKEIAALGIILTGIGSASGRLAVSWISDKIGRKAAMVAIAVMTLTASLVMIIAEGILFLICIMLIAFGFGGAASVYSTMTAESFGTKYGGLNFGLVMIGFGVSALTFQNIANFKLLSVEASFILAAVTCVIAIVLVLLMKNPGKNMTKNK